MTTSPHTLQSKINEILSTHCADAHPSFDDCQQNKDLLSLIKTVGEKACGEKEHGDYPDYTSTDCFDCGEEYMREQIKKNIKDIISGKVRL